MLCRYQTWDKKYCDNVKGARRVVTVRNSQDGTRWSDDWGCLDNPQTSEHCKKFNITAMVTPGPDDPPELGAGVPMWLELITGLCRVLPD